MILFLFNKEEEKTEKRNITQSSCGMATHPDSCKTVLVLLLLLLYSPLSPQALFVTISEVCWSQKNVISWAGRRKPAGNNPAV
jgi:hypothetical protein